MYSKSQRRAELCKLLLSYVLSRRSLLLPFEKFPASLGLSERGMKVYLSIYNDFPKYIDDNFTHKLVIVTLFAVLYDKEYPIKITQREFHIKKNKAHTKYIVAS